MTQEQITVEVMADGPVETVWKAYTSPDHVTRWNFASDDWHCPSAKGDLREGGRFSSRMEAKDGSMGFDFAGTYTRIVMHERIDYVFGDRSASVTFLPDSEKVRVSVSFVPETVFPPEQQRAGWQAILDNFAKHVATLNA